MDRNIEIILEGTEETVRFRLNTNEIQVKETISGIVVKGLALENGDFRVRSAPQEGPHYRSTDFKKDKIDAFSDINKFYLLLDKLNFGL